MDAILEKLRLRLASGGVSPGRAQLVECLSGPLPWVEHTETVKSCDARVWTASVSGWRLTLADFSIADQPGKKSGDRGQNVAMADTVDGIIIFSDDDLMHEVASFLLKNMVTCGPGKSAAGTTVIER